MKTTALSLFLLLVAGLVQAHEFTCQVTGALTGPLRFQSGYTYFVHPEVLAGVDQLSLQGLSNTTIHFLGPISASVAYQGSYRDDSGVVNVVDCTNIVLTGLNVTNTKVFTPGNLVSESSCAVNVSRSTCTLSQARLTGNGKITLSAHSGSVVRLLDSTLTGYYFELFVAGSNLSAERVVLNQHNRRAADSHSALLTGSSHRHAVTNVLYQNTDVELTDVTFNMTTGRAVVSGNGSYTTRSIVTLSRPTFNVGQLFGMAAWHRNFNSITVVLREPVPGLVNYVSSPNIGFGRFVNYYTSPTRPNSNSPIVVDGLSSEDVVVQ